MLKFSLKNTFLPLLLAATFLMQGCAGGGIEEVPIDAGLLSSYQQMAHPNSAQNPVEEVDCYLDYSDGMMPKIGGDVAFYETLLNGLGRNKNVVKFYRVGKEEKPVLFTGEQAADFRNPKNYTDLLSKLEGAVAAITANKNRSAVFVTDFEQITGAVLNPNAPDKRFNNRDNRFWGTKYFTDWLKAGNEIDIFPTPCTANGQPNHAYAMVFTPASVLHNEKAYSNSILSYILRSAPNQPRLPYSAGNFKISQQQKAAETGNANDNVIVMENITNTKDKGFEYYAFTSSDLVNFNTDETQKADLRIINKVLIQSENPALTNVEYGLKVTDITESMMDYYNTKTQEAPEVATDAETGAKDTVANKPVTFNYKGGTAVTDVFMPVYNKETGAIGIKLNPDFAGVPAGTLYQVDVILKSAQLQDFSADENLLKLNYTPTFSINPLGGSIKDAMMAVANNAAGQTLYTFYIKISK